MPVEAPPIAASTDPDPWLLAAVVWDDEGDPGAGRGPGASYGAAEELEAEDFLPRWHAIWRAVQRAHEVDPKRQDFPVAVQREACRDMSEAEATRRLVDLFELAQQHSHRLTFVDVRAQMIRERSTRSRTTLAANGVAQDLGSKHPDLYALGDAASDLEGIAADVRAAGLTSDTDLPGLTLDDDGLALKWIPTGWFDSTKGFEDDGSLVIAGARTGGGKSTVALNLARLWFEQPEEAGAVVYWSCEMGRRTLTRRLLASVARVPEEEWDRPGNQAAIRQAKGRFTEYGERLILFGPDDASFDIRTITNRTRAIAHRRKVGLVIVDYGQQVQVRHERCSNDVERLTRVSNDLQALSRELHSVVFVPVQLNRNASGVDAEPRLEHIRQCGAFEQDADQVWIMHHEDRGPARRILTVNRAKMRNGQPSAFDLSWDMRLCLLEDQSPDRLKAVHSQEFI